MSRYAVIDADGLVVNHIEWDGVTEWAPPDGHTARLLADDESPVKHVAIYDDKTDTFSDNGTYKGEDATIPYSPEKKLEALLDTLVSRGGLTEAEAGLISKAEITVDGEVIEADPIIP